MEKPILVFQTDFTYKEGAVCAMYGVVKSVDRTLEIMDGSHELPKFDVWSASYRLYQSMEYWPEGTVFVSVVDPGVGTNRKACVAKTCNGYYIVTPDNGTLTHVKEHFGIEAVREIDESVNRLKSKNSSSSVFHGRDVFGYCAARFASGIIDFEGVGPEYNVDDIVSIKINKPTEVILSDYTPAIEGIIEIDDPNFGNSWTNIPTSMLKDMGAEYGDMINVMIYNGDEIVYEHNMKFAATFGDVEPKETVLYNNELLNLAVAVSQGDFVSEHNIGYGEKWKIVISK